MNSVSDLQKQELSSQGIVVELLVAGGEPRGVEVIHCLLDHALRCGVKTVEDEGGKIWRS